MSKTPTPRTPIFVKDCKWTEPFASRNLSHIPPCFLVMYVRFHPKCSISLIGSLIISFGFDALICAKAQEVSGEISQKGSKFSESSSKKSPLPDKYDDSIEEGRAPVTSWIIKHDYFLNCLTIEPPTVLLTGLGKLPKPLVINNS